MSSTARSGAAASSVSNGAAVGGGTAGSAATHGTAAAPLDVVGVGLGPFNLGLAALLDGVDGARAVFLEQRDDFVWHPGLLLEEAEIQVPFLADLVTLADPTSRHTFLNYLHEHGRLYRFYFHERFHLLRREFQAYCRWVAGRLESCRFGRRVVDVREQPDGSWVVEAEAADGTRERHHARHVVFGVGAAPRVPEPVAPHLPAGADATADGRLLHSAAYAGHREALLRRPSVAVVGSGQSAAEVFLDLLEHADRTTRIDWFTRSRGFLAMEYSKLGLEHFTPEYVDHFHGLPGDRRDALRAGQDLLYKGISAETSARIYDLLYRRTVDGAEPPVSYRARTELRALSPDGDGWRLTLAHRDEQRTAELRSAAVVLATGYAARPLPIAPELVARDAQGRPIVERDYRLRRPDGRPSTLLAQNAELHSHGVGTPDLGLGAHRNATIVNGLLGREVYAVRDRNVFQRFGLGDLVDVDATGGAATVADPTAAPVAAVAPGTAGA